MLVENFPDIAEYTDRLVQVATVKRKAQTWDPAYVYVDLGPDFRRQHLYEAIGAYQQRQRRFGGA